MSKKTEKKQKSGIAPRVVKRNWDKALTKPLIAEFEVPIESIDLTPETRRKLESVFKQIGDGNVLSQNTIIVGKNGSDGSTGDSDWEVTASVTGTAIIADIDGDIDGDLDFKIPPVPL